MADRPEDVRITDLFDPEYNPEMVAAFELLEPVVAKIEWNADKVWAEAMEATGLDDVGDSIHVEPLDVLLNCYATTNTLSSLGKYGMWSNLVDFAKNKLLVVDLLNRHPEIHDIEIERPIIIAGQGRTGTTHMHNLMSSDPALRTLPYWESLEPVAPLAEQGVEYEVDPRWLRCEEKCNSINDRAPHFRRMHDMYPDHVHEEIQLLGIAFSSMLFETMSLVPDYRDWFLATDQTPFYDFMKTVLKALTFLRGGERWLLKSPQHVEQFQPLMNVFPDATIVCTHRDPVSVAGSMATMVTYTSRFSAEPSRLADVGSYWVDRFETMLHTAAEQRSIFGPDQSIDVVFHEFMADDIATVEGIYAKADQPFTPEVRAGMEQFMVDHPRGKYGRVKYAIEDFGIDRAAFRKRTAAYVDQFGVQQEGD